MLPVLGVLFAVAGCLALFLAFLYRHPLPRTEGQLWIEGLTEPVTLSRDVHGYVEIEATSIADAVFAQGFAHAQDRLWQMELNRRVGSGRLAEIFGALALPADAFVRRLGLRRSAGTSLEALQDEERSLLEAYCAGVNAGRDSLSWRLPLEFRLLGFYPEPWTVIDSLTWIQVMSMDLCSNWEQEILRAKLLARVGPRLASLLHLFTRGGSVTLPAAEDGETTADLYNRLTALYTAARGYLPNAGLPGGSNAWVVSGKHTASGKPLLANDPHLVGRVPAVWHEVRLRAPALDVQGVSFPGLPLVVIGHNQKVAWGITNSFADTQDLFIERFHPEDKTQVETENGYQPVQCFEETILVKGAAPVIERISATRHGPILVSSETEALALKWINQEPSHPVATLLAMNKAGSAAAFKEALRDWQAPSSNFLYADVEGNIGFVMAGDVPVRKNGTGLTPVPGWNGEYEWVSKIPFEELPQVSNPECGYIVNANNPVVNTSFPHHITWDWQGSARATRIESLLKGRTGLTPDDFATMQMDFHSTTGLRFVRACAEVRTRNRGEGKVLALLREWDGDGSASSVGMAIYQVMLLTTMGAILSPLLGEDLKGEFLGSPTNPLAVMAGHTGRYTTWLVDLLEEPERFAELGHPTSLGEVLASSLGEATRYLEERLGPDPTRWKWGKLHRLGFQHALGINRVLGGLFNSPGIPMGGDTDTVFQTAVIPHQPFAQSWCPSWRQVVDLADPSAGRTILPTGQSGHPASPNYMDGFKLWQKGELRAHPTELLKVLRLSPKRP